MLVRWEHGLNVHQAVERTALLRVETVGVASGVESSGALVRRKLAQSAEAALNRGLLVGWKRGPVARGSGYLVALLRRQVLHILVALNDAITLRLRHGIELRKAVAHALLRYLRKVMKAGLVFQRLLLLGRVEGAMRVHPLGKVLATRRVDAGGSTFVAFDGSKPRSASRSRLLRLRLILSRLLLKLLRLRPLLSGLLRLTLLRCMLLGLALLPSSASPMLRVGGLMLLRRLLLLCFWRRALRVGSRRLVLLGALRVHHRRAAEQ